MTADTLADSAPATDVAPAYPAHWRIARLGDVALSFISGGTPSTKSPDLWDGDFPWTTSAPIAANDVHLDRAQRFVTKAGLASSATNLVPAGNLLIGTRVGVGKAVVNDMDIAISQDLTGTVLDHTLVNALYLAYYIKTAAVQGFLDGRKRGTTIKGISRFDLHELPLVLPPLPEQRAIACILRAAQDTIAARRRQVTLERERKAALMQRLFTHGVRGEPTQQTAIGEMPQSWQVVRLGDALEKTQYGLSLRGESVGAYPILRMNNLAEGYVDTADLQYVTTDDTILHRFQLTHGDILFNRTNSYELVGKTALFDLPGKFLFASYLIRVIPLPEILLSGFLNAYFNAARTQQRLRMLASRGVSQSNISASKLQEFSILLPSLDEQRVIADTLAACDTKIAALEREITLHEELFRALLEELMSGRLSALPLVEIAANATDS